VLGITDLRITPLPSRRNAQINVSGNQIRAAVRLNRPLVVVFDTDATSLAYGRNQCTLDGRGSVGEIVLLSARRMTVQANTVSHQADAVSMRPTTGFGGAATPIGNITSSNIVLDGAQLPAPFDALNLTA
jgi:hypothetical protein